MRKLDIGIQSGDWYDEKRPDESLQFIKSCGFESIDYNINNMFSATFQEDTLTSFFDQSLEELYAYYQPMKDAAKKYGIHFSQFHGLFPIYFHGEDQKNEYLIRATEQMMAVASYLECPYIVVHPWSGVTMQKEEEIEINLSIYRRLIPAAKKYGVGICLENLFKHNYLRCVQGACTDAGEAKWYIDTLNAEAGEEIFGLCFDIGHANITGRNLYQYITTLGGRIKALHIHDNDGTNDAHMFPYTQRDCSGLRTTILWDEFVRGLRDAGYEGALSFETFLGVNAFPKEVKKEALTLLSAIGRHFRNSILQTRD